MPPAPTVEHDRWTNANTQPTFVRRYSKYRSKDILARKLFRQHPLHARQSQSTPLPELIDRPVTRSQRLRARSPKQSDDLGDQLFFSEDSRSASAASEALGHTIFSNTHHSRIDASGFVQQRPAATILAQNVLLNSSIASAPPWEPLMSRCQTPLAKDRASTPYDACGEVTGGTFEFPSLNNVVRSSGKLPHHRSLGTTTISKLMASNRAFVEFDPLGRGRTPISRPPSEGREELRAA
jgi:hypothetical protein